jgi:adenine phosphoribosyltransferase
MNPEREAHVHEIRSLIRDVPDFPKPGIVFKDITPLLASNRGLELTTQMLAEPFVSMDIKHVIGLESRGFLFGTNIAHILGAGFVPVRKPGKLPSKTESVSYELEYGMDEVEIHSDAIQPGEHVLIHDDVIATGGTAKAATELVEKLGGKVVGYSFILELSFLKGRERLKDVLVDSLVVV